MASIYELNKDYAELSAMLEVAETEEEIQAIQDTLEMINVSIEEKLENTGKFIKKYGKRLSLVLKQKSTVLTAMKKTKENFVERLKNNVEFALKEKGLEMLTVGTFKCGYRKSESVEIINLDVIPADYTKVEIKADKTAIKKAIKAGQTVEGAEIKVKQNFYIKIGGADMEFRTLRENEIDCRIQSLSEKNGAVGAVVLLYKDARVDMRMLDEVVGALNWQREHKNCWRSFILHRFDLQRKNW